MFEEIKAKMVMVSGTCNTNPPSRPWPQTPMPHHNCSTTALSLQLEELRTAVLALQDKAEELTKQQMAGLDELLEKSC